MDQIMAAIPERFRKESVVASVTALYDAWAKMRMQMLDILEEK